MFRSYTWPLVAALILISHPLVAGEPTPSPVAGADEAALEEPVTDSRAGVRVFIDEESGEVRSPTQAEMAEMGEQFSQQYFGRSVEKPVVHHADGSISKELGPQHRMYSVARLSNDGELETQCLPAEQAADFLGNDDSSEPDLETLVDGAPSQ